VPNLVTCIAKEAIVEGGKSHGDRLYDEQKVRSPGCRLLRASSPPPTLRCSCDNARFLSREHRQFTRHTES
jgi:hypothetical protein